MASDQLNRIREAAEHIQARKKERPELGVILGPGLGDFALEFGHTDPPLSAIGVWGSCGPRSFPGRAVRPKGGARKIRRQSARRAAPAK